LDEGIDELTYASATATNVRGMVSGLSTVTVRLVLVVSLSSASRARAATVALPLATLFEFQAIE